MISFRYTLHILLWKHLLNRFIQCTYIWNYISLLFNILCIRRFGGDRATFLSIKFVAQCTQTYIPVTVYVQSTNSKVIVYIAYNHCLYSRIGIERVTLICVLKKWCTVPDKQVLISWNPSQCKIKKMCTAAFLHSIWNK